MQQGYGYSWVYAWLGLALVLGLDFGADHIVTTQQQQNNHVRHIHTPNRLYSS